MGTRDPSISGASPHLKSRGLANRSAMEYPAQVPEEIAGLLSRRDILKRASVLSLGGLVLSALPVADRIIAAVAPAEAAVNLADATLQAVADTLIPAAPPS